MQLATLDSSLFVVGPLGLFLISTRIPFIIFRIPKILRTFSWRHRRATLQVALREPWSHQLIWMEVYSATSSHAMSLHLRVDHPWLRHYHHSAKHSFQRHGAPDDHLAYSFILGHPPEAKDW